jgi:hypothetical protein
MRQGFGGGGCVTRCGADKGLQGPCIVFLSFVPQPRGRQLLSASVYTCGMRKKDWFLIFWRCKVIEKIERFTHHYSYETSSTTLPLPYFPVHTLLL